MKKTLIIKLALLYAAVCGAQPELWSTIYDFGLGTGVTKIMKDPNRSFVYAIDRNNSEILFIDLDRQVVSKRLHVGETPTCFDVDDSGNYLYVGNGGDGSGSSGSYRIAKINLDTQEQVDSFAVPSIIVNGSVFRAENITCGSGNLLFYNAGYKIWNSGLGRMMDGSTGADLGAISRIKSPMVMTPDRKKLYGQYIYSGNLGEMGVWDVSSTAFQKVDSKRYSPYPYGWDYNNYSISADGKLLAYGKKLFNANNLDDVQGDFSELVYALNSDGSIAFGKDTIWDTTTFAETGSATKISDLPFSCTIVDFDEVGGVLYAFNAADQRLYAIGTRYMGELSIFLPESAVESDGVLTGLVSVSKAPDNDLAVDLDSDDLSEIKIPTNTVFIPAGSTSAVFRVEVQDDSDRDGTQKVLVSATAVGYGSTSKEVKVYNDDGGVITLLLPDFAVEGDGIVTGVVELSEAAFTDQIVHFASDDPSELNPVDTLVVPSGQTNAMFDIAIEDDSLRDGAQRATITATAQGHLSGISEMMVLDNDAPSLALVLPHLIDEDTGTVEGTLLVGPAPNQDMTVELVSDNPSKLEGASILVRSGQNRIPFTLQVVDNRLIDGIQGSTITAQAEGYASGNASVFIEDDDGKSLHLDLPVGVFEGQGTLTNSAMVYLDGIAVTDLHILLQSLDSSEVTVPPTVTIPAGASNAFFNVTAVDDTEVDGRQHPVIQASMPGFNSANVAMGISDDEFHHFSVSGLEAEEPGNIPLPCTVHAENTDGEYVGTYSGPAWLSASLGSSPLAVDPGNSITISNGIWQGAVTLHGVGNAANLIIDDGAGHSGTNTLDLVKLNIVKMATDWTEPYIYMVHRSKVSPNKSKLIWYNTDTDTIDQALDAGENATDLTVHYGDNRIYVSNWRRAETRVFDRTSKQELDPLLLGGDVYKINAAGAGRVITEGEDQWVRMSMRSTTDSSELTYKYPVREGDGDCSLDGRYYYHTDNNSSGARLSRFTITNDTFASEISVKTKYYYGSRNVFVSMDGKRVYNCGYIYDGDLKELLNIGSAIYAASAYGDMVLTKTKVFNGINGEEMYTLPFSTSVMAFSGDQSELLLFDSASGSVTSLATSAIMPIPEPAMVPAPAVGSVVGANLPELSWSGAPTAIGYDIYIGTDSNAVAIAGTNSVEYLGRRTDTGFQLPEGTLSGNETYFWRVDIVAFGNQIVTGDVWNFQTASISVDPYELVVDGMAASYTQTVSVAIDSSVGMPVSWTASCTNDWVILRQTSGTTSGSLDVGIDLTGLAAGSYKAEIEFSDGSATLVVPVSLSVENMRIVKMATDWTLPYIYMVHTSTTSPNKSRLIWYNTDTDTIEQVLDAGENATDLTVHYGDNRIYVSNWRRAETRVFDRTSKQELDPLLLGGDVYKINAAGAGRVITEGEDQWVRMSMRSTTDSSELTYKYPVREGDGDCSLDGRYYYHTDNNSSGARLSRFTITNDTFASEISVKTKYYYGSRNVFVSGDGTRVFNCGVAYRTSDLKEVKNLGREMYAASFYGRYAVTATDLMDVDANASVLSLQGAGNVSAFSGDQSKLVLFNSTDKSLVVQPLDSVPGGMPVPGLSPLVPDGSVVAGNHSDLAWRRVPLALQYDVYFGADSNAVATATTNQVEYLGRTESNTMMLPPSSIEAGSTYYWRVDALGPDGILSSKVWSFMVGGLSFSPASLDSVLFNIDGLTTQELLIDMEEATGAWQVVSMPSWLSASETNGTGSATLMLEINKDALGFGDNSGEILVSSDGTVFAEPVVVKRLNETLKCITAHPVQDKVYAVSYQPGDDESYLLEIGVDPLRAERVLELPENITDMDIDASGTNLFAISFKDGSLARVDLEAFEVRDIKKVPGTAKHSSATHFNVEAGNNGIVFYIDGNWAPAVHVFDYEAGVDLSTYNNNGDGLGGLAYDDVRNKLYSWRQYGWGAGVISSWVYTFDVVDNKLVKVDTSSQQGRDPLNSPLLLVDDGQSLINKKRRFSTADLAVVEASYSENIYSATFDGRLAIGSSKIYRGADGTVVGNLPKSSTLHACPPGNRGVVWYDSSTKTLGYTHFAELLGPLVQATNLLPKAGTTVPVSQESLVWDDQGGVMCYRVYFSTNRDEVASASTNSSCYQGQVVNSSWNIPAPGLRAGQTYYWRVDAVGYDDRTIAGTVQDFAVAEVVTPKMVLSPGSLTNTEVVVGESLVRTLVVSNAGNADLEFSIRGGGGGNNVPQVSNLVLNGDFEDGNVGFSTGYIYKDVGTSSPSSGQYGVGDDPKAWHGGLYALNDHTSGTGNMWMANGDTSPNTLWEQSVDVVAGKTYRFSAWAAILYTDNAQLEFFVDGTSVGTLNVVQEGWLQFSGNWTAASSTNVVLSIRNISSGVFEAYAIDDIVFETVESGLIAYYPFNGSADDESGNGHDGTASGATPTADRFGNADSAYLFDGNDDYIAVPDSTDLRLANTDFAIATWFNESERNPSYNDALITKRGSGGANGWFSSISGSLAGSGIGKLYYQISGGYDPYVYSSSSVSLGEWHQSVLTYDLDSKTLRFYLDGVLDSEHANIPPPNAATTANMIIGRDSASTSYAFHGAIDEIRIYNRMLSASEILALYQTTDGPGESWLTVDPKSGTVPPGSSVSVSVRFDAAGFAAGDSSNVVLVVTGNDAATPSNAVPVSITVVADEESDRDGDLMPDGWEKRYFGSAANGDPAEDSDGDGQNNLEEYIAGMDPTNATSAFTVRASNTPTGGEFILSWDAVTGRVYSIYWQTNLPDAFQTLETGIRYPQNSYTDRVHSAEDQGFYWIDVGLE